MTGEVFMLAQVRVEIYDQTKLIEKFRTLKCMEYDATQDRWLWIYRKEASHLKFNVPFKKIPRNCRDVILGSFFLRDDGRGYLNTNSFDRAIAAIPFFDKELGRDVLKFTSLDIVNRLIDQEELEIGLHQSYFGDFDPYERDFDQEMRERISAIEKIAISKEHKFQLIQEQTETRTKEQLDLVERIACHYYEEGLSGLEMILRMRQHIAIQHCLGNTEFSLYDGIQALYGRNVASPPCQVDGIPMGD